MSDPRPSSWELAPVPLLDLDATGAVLAWNAAAGRVLASASVVDATAALRAGGLDAVLHDAVEGREAARPLRLASGERPGLSARARASVRRGPGGAVEGYVLALEVGGCGRDPDRCAESDLRRLHAILDAIPAPIFYKDAAGLYRGCNAAFEAAVGRTRHELAGRGVEMIAPPDLAAVYRAADEELFARGGAQIYETSMVFADGRRHEIVLHKATFDDDDGRRVGLVGSYLDVTRRKEMERALRESEERLELALSATDQIAWDWDVRADRLVVGANIWGRLGRTPEEVARAGDALRLLHPDDVPRLRAAFGAILERGTVDVECRVASTDGEWRDFSVAARAVDEDERGARRIVGTAVDVTDKKRLHERLLLADRLASLGTLAAGMGHEINNPLAYASANLDFAREAVRTGDPEAAAELSAALDEARDGLRRVAHIVQDLRIFTRPRAATGAVDPREVVRSSANIAGGELRIARAALRLDLGPVPAIAGDAARLGQVVVNLLVNAAQALPQTGGAIEVRTARAPDGRVAIEVGDDGCGIAPEALGRIFDPFFTTKPPGVGTGLGLFVSHGLVGEMGGEIRVESEVGRGTTFRVLLPPAPE